MKTTARIEYTTQGRYRTQRGAKEVSASAEKLPEAVEAAVRRLEARGAFSIEVRYEAPPERAAKAKIAEIDAERAAKTACRAINAFSGAAPFAEPEGLRFFVRAFVLECLAKAEKQSAGQPDLLELVEEARLFVESPASGLK
jgi:hypothetical protein